MARFTIFGTGKMGNAIGSVLTDGGSTVTHVSHGGGGTVDGDVVILAVPYHALNEIVEEYGDQLRGKVVVDISNPLNFETFDSLVVPEGSSAAAELAAKLPDSSVLKAFNTNFAATLASKKVGDETTTVLVAGDDDAGKQVLVTALEAGGVSPIDAGSLARAHELEAIGFLQLTLAVGEKLPWTGGFAVAR
jgi:8-hydroxy-5-deazaflavin:NADPH oxidoreductase